jgi:hypothetical protein
MDLRYHLAKGFFTDEHDRHVYDNGKLQTIIPAAKIGEPTDMVMQEGLGPIVTGFMYIGDATHPSGCRCDGCCADRWFFLMETLRRSGSTRRVQCSVDGKVIKRERHEDGTADVWECWVKDIAFTLTPMNTTTWVELLKSLSAVVHVNRDMDLAIRKSAHGIDDLAPYAGDGSLSFGNAVEYLVKAKGLNNKLAEWTAARIFERLGAH